MDDGIRHMLLDLMWYMNSHGQKMLLKQVQNIPLTYNAIMNPSMISVKQLSNMLSNSDFVIDSRNLDSFLHKHIRIDDYGNYRYTVIDGTALNKQFTKGLELIHLLNYNFFAHHTTLETGYATLFIMI